MPEMDKTLLPYIFPATAYLVAQWVRLWLCGQKVITSNPSKNKLLGP